MIFVDFKTYLPARVGDLTTGLTDYRKNKSVYTFITNIVFVYKTTPSNSGVCIKVTRREKLTVDANNFTHFEK